MTNNSMIGRHTPSNAGTGFRKSMTQWNSIQVKQNCIEKNIKCHCIGKYKKPTDVMMQKYRIKKLRCAVNTLPQLYDMNARKKDELMSAHC